MHKLSQQESNYKQGLQMRLDQQYKQKIAQKEKELEQQYQVKLQKTVAEHDTTIKQQLSQEMNKHLSEELSKKEQTHTKELQKMKSQVIADTKKLAEANETEAMNELATSNAKKVKTLNKEIKDKEVMLDQAVDRSSELTNKLNDVQAAAYLKDQKIKKMTEEAAKMKTALSQDEKNLSGRATAYKNAEEEKNLISLKLTQAQHQISEQNATINDLRMVEQTAARSSEDRIKEMQSKQEKEVKNLKRQVEAKVRLIETGKQSTEQEVQKEQNLQSEIQNQKLKIKELQTQSENLKKQIDQIKKDEAIQKEQNDKTAGELAQEKKSNVYLADKLKGSEQQVVDDMKKEEKRVDELHIYIKEEQTSKIRLNKEMKTKINALTESLKSQKQELASNIASKTKESEELKQKLNESRQLIDQYKLQIA